MNTSLSIGEVIKSAWVQFKPVWWQMSLTFLGLIVAYKIIEESFYKQSILGALVLLLLSALSVYTMTRISLMVVHKENLEWKNLSKINWRIVFFVVILTFISSLIYLTGIILLVIPGFIALARFGFSTWALIDENLKPIEALKRSLALTKGHTLDVLMIVFAFLVMAIVIGIATFALGLIIFVPFQMVAMAHVYSVLRNKSIPSIEHVEPPMVQA